MESKLHAVYVGSYLPTSLGIGYPFYTTQPVEAGCDDYRRRTCRPDRVASGVWATRRRSRRYPASTELAYKPGEHPQNNAPVISGLTAQPSYADGPRDGHGQEGAAYPRIRAYIKLTKPAEENQSSQQRSANRAAGLWFKSHFSLARFDIT